MRNVLVSAHLCAWSGHSNSRRERQVHWVSFMGDGRALSVSPSLLVTFACRSDLDDEGGVSEVHAVGGSPASNELPQIQTIERRAHAHTRIKTKNRTRTHEHINTKQIQRRARTRIQKQQTYHTKKRDEERQTHNQNTATDTHTNARHTNAPENTSRGRDVRAKVREVFFIFGAQACVCQYNKVGITRQDDLRAFQMMPSAHAGPIYAEARRNDGCQCPRRRFVCAQG